MKQTDLKKIANNCAEKIVGSRQNGSYFLTPFQHIIIDDFLPNSLAQECMDGFPSLDSKIWEHSNDPGVEVKSRTKWTSDFDIPEPISHVVRIVNSSIILKAISETLSIPKLMPDPYFSGGGVKCFGKRRASGYSCRWKLS